ncbi:hypothetical protein [Brevundimonas balnearis]|uniref:EF-hand domain-containing protein n=1 Tax=Brevundimonas balnearis TaxID=1572858 RepID=A0ABV6R1B7_9CAUL
MKRIIYGTAFGLIVLTAGAAIAQEPRGPGGPGMAMARADADGDGIITRDEFVEARLASLRRLDADANGTVTREEAEAARTQLQAQAEARAETRAERRRERNQRRADRRMERLPITLAEAEAQATAGFDRFDANGDGRLTTEEMDEARARMWAARAGAGGFPGSPDGGEE